MVIILRFISGEQNPFHEIGTRPLTLGNPDLIENLAEELYHAIERDYNDVLKSFGDRKTSLEVGGGTTVAPSKRLVRRRFKAYEIDAGSGFTNTEIRYRGSQSGVFRLQGDLYRLLEDKEYGPKIFPSKIILFWGSGPERVHGNWNLAKYMETVKGVEPGSLEYWDEVEEIYRRLVEKIDEPGYIIVVSPRFACHCLPEGRPSIGDGGWLEEGGDFLVEAYILGDLGGDVTLYGYDEEDLEKVVHTELQQAYMEDAKRQLETERKARIWTRHGIVKAYSMQDAEEAIEQALSEIIEQYEGEGITRVDAMVARFG